MSEARGQVQMRAVSGDEAGLRLDRWFQRHFPELSHGALQKLLRTGQVRIDGKRVEGKDRVEPGQTVRLPPGVTAAPPPCQAAPRPRRTLSDRDAQEIQSLVIHRDDWVIALNKPPGLAVQGGSGTERHVDGMLDALRFGFEERPRLVHRLDKDTSGLLLIARTGQSAKRLAESFRDRETEKLYWAVVVGVPPQAGGRDRPAARQAARRARPRDHAGRPRGGPEGADPFQGARPRRQPRRAAGAVAAHRPHPSAARALRRDRLPDPGRPQVRRRGGAAVGGRRCAAPASACAAACAAASVGQGHARRCRPSRRRISADARGVRLLDRRRSSEKLGA